MGAQVYLLYCARMQHATRRLERVRPIVAVGSLLALQTLLQLPHLTRPPTGFHLWRQTQTLAVARNLHEEGLNPFLPRVDARGQGPGYAGMEFPITNLTIALGYRALGERDAVHRVVMLGFSFLAILGCYAWVAGLLRSPLAGWVAALILILSPLFDYYSIAAMPDLSMLGFLMLGMAGIQSASSSGRLWPAVWGSGALSLGALIKLSSMLAWPAALLCLPAVWSRRTRGWRVGLLLSLLLGLGAAIAWYVHADRLSATYGIDDFLLRTMLPYPPAIMLPVLGKVVLQWLPEVYLSYPEFILLLFGLPVLASAAGRPWRPVALVYAGGLALYAFAFLPRLEIHDYYMLVALPLLVLISTLGALRLLAMAQERRAAAMALAILGVAALVMGPYRAQSRYLRGRVHADLATLSTHLDRVIPDRRMPVIAASDPSPSIYLYFMRRKGWRITADEASGRMEGMIAQGARYLVSDSRVLEEQPELRARLRRISSHGKFNVFSVTPAASEPRTEGRLRPRWPAPRPTEGSSASSSP
jgi:hypothetical protein